MIVTLNRLVVVIIHVLATSLLRGAYHTAFPTHT